MLIALIVGVTFRSIGAPVVTLAAGAHLLRRRPARRRLGRRAHRAYAAPAELEPLIVVLLLGIVTDYAIFYLSGMRHRLRAAGPRGRAARAHDGPVHAHHPRRRPHGRRRHGRARRGDAALLPHLRARAWRSPSSSGWPWRSRSCRRCWRIASAACCSGRACGRPAPRLSSLAAVTARRCRRLSPSHDEPPVAAAHISALCVAVAAGRRQRPPRHPSRPRSHQQPAARARPGEAAATGGVRGFRRRHPLAHRGRPRAAGHRRPARRARRAAGRDRRTAGGAGRRSARASNRRPAAGGRHRVTPPVAVSPSRRTATRRATSWSSTRIRWGRPASARLHGAAGRDAVAACQAGLGGVHGRRTRATPRLPRTRWTARWGTWAASPSPCSLVDLLLLVVFLRVPCWRPSTCWRASVLALAASLGSRPTCSRCCWAAKTSRTTCRSPPSVLLVSLGSDYNIFLVGRIWEEAKVRPMRRAIESAVPRARRAISVAAAGSGAQLRRSSALIDLELVPPARLPAFRRRADRLVLRALAAGAGAGRAVRAPWPAQCAAT